MPWLNAKEREPYKAFAAERNLPLPDKLHWVHDSHYNDFVRSGANEGLMLKKYVIAYGYLGSLKTYHAYSTKEAVEMFENKKNLGDINTIWLCIKQPLRVKKETSSCA